MKRSTSKQADNSYSNDGSSAKRFSSSGNQSYGSQSSVSGYGSGYYNSNEMAAYSFNAMNQSSNLYGQPSPSQPWAFPQSPGNHGSSNQKQYQSNTFMFDPRQPPPPLPENSRNSPSPGNPPLPPNLPNNSNKSASRMPFSKGGGKRGFHNQRGSYHKRGGFGNISKVNTGGKNPNKQNNNAGPKNPKQNSNNIKSNEIDNGQIVINKKGKRKSMGARYSKPKGENDHEYCVKALELEKEYNRMQKSGMLILKFPDPELNKFIVKGYSSAIERVHFQQPSTPRYCFIQLKEGSDIDQIKAELSEIPFGTGKIKAEKKLQPEESQPVTPEEIDPFTLYIGNLPTKISVKTVKDHFPGAVRIDIGYAQRMKYTRYAFIRFPNFEQAVDAFKKSFHSIIGHRNLIVRFRRVKGNVGYPEPQVQKKEKISPIESSSTVTTSVTPPPSNELFNSMNAETVTTDDDTITNLSVVNVNADDDNQTKTVDITRETSHDLKENILAEARRLLITTSSIINADTLVEINKPIQIKTEPPSSPTFEDGELLGTKIKDEPEELDDDELLAQCFIEHVEYEYEEEEEFDDGARSPIPMSVIKEPTWEDIRRLELAQTEQKPDIESLTSLNSSNNPGNNNSNTYTDPVNTVFNSTKNDLFSVQKKNDHLDDLFSAMNPDPDDDDLETQIN